MKKKAIINTRILDPRNNIDEIGGILINDIGKIEAIGKRLQKKMFRMLRFMIAKTKCRSRE